MPASYADFRAEIRAIRGRRHFSIGEIVWTPWQRSEVFNGFRQLEGAGYIAPGESRQLIRLLEQEVRIGYWPHVRSESFRIAVGENLCVIPNMKARGANSNPPNRFEKLSVELEPGALVDDDGNPLPLRTQFLRDDAQSIITFNNSPDIPFGAGVSPYRGCERGRKGARQKRGRRIFSHPRKVAKSGVDS